MVDAIISFLRALPAALGLLAFTDPVLTSPLVTLVVVALVAALLIIATMVASMRTSGRGSPVHPTRRTELSAPLTQGDPDAAGHVRRRGPDQAVMAA